MSQPIEKLDLPEIQRLYDDHELRATRFKGSELTFEELADLAIQGVANALTGHEISHIEYAVTHARDRLQKKQSLGEAVAGAIQDLKKFQDEA